MIVDIALGIVLAVVIILAAVAVLYLLFTTEVGLWLLKWTAFFAVFFLVIFGLIWLLVSLPSDYQKPAMAVFVFAFIIYMAWDEL